jgi:LacI family transcriptional regulator
LAQSLKSRETHTLGVLIPDIERPFFATVVSGIQSIATEAGYRVMICQSKESYRTEVSNVQALIASQVDGLLICHSRETENFDHVKPQACRGIPVVHFDRVSNEVDSAKVILDDWNGAFKVTEHLIQQGARHIAILAGPESLLISRNRLAGYQSALRHYELPLRPEYEVHIEFQTEQAEAALDAWLALPEPPDALFCFNDLLALGALRALHEAGMRVPEDVAVVGWDDVEDSRYSTPTLTTISPDKQEIASIAVGFLAARLGKEGGAAPRSVTAGFELVVRESTGGAAVRASP